MSKLHNRYRWQKVRRHQRRVQPLCAMCLQRGINAPATLVDHIIPHHGDPNKFWFGPLQSLCDACHFSVKQQAERLGYRLDAGLDGWPLDPAHPSNRPRPGHARAPGGRE
jgi:5-methylcytosine-specific restriction enzyme A